ncbi:hypothetical protein JM93_00974 [Roseibium hamelinense]|uniref:Uncharacterized protein n=1 Tax=Roseibium hamelinense TaxID=150831 RepID=A0A562TIC2_9HYPH|nr:hypothetical protein [Roseibium hamelinense]TWI93417.1 hypothetical protein JM93_00974 [Roseibium hamelinense]
MNIYTAKCFLVDHGLNYHRDRLPWFSQSLYRLKIEAEPIADTGRLGRPFWDRAPRSPH